MITLRGITWENPRGFDPLVAAATQWMETHPEVEIIWEQQPWYLFEEKILASLAAGDGKFDLIMFDHPWVGKLAGEKWLLPWDSLLGDEYVAALHQRVIVPSVESYVWNGRLWALPLDGASHAALYRDDLVTAAFLPQTWEDIAIWAKAHHSPPHRYGLVLSLEGVLGHCLFLSMMAGLGQPAFHDPENPACDSQAAEYVLRLLKELIQFVPPGSLQWGPWDIYDHMTQHSDVAYSPSIFAYVNYFAGQPHSQHLRLGTVPSFSETGAGRPILGGVGFGIAHTCQHVKEAAEYGRFLMSNPIQNELFTQHSGQPATKSAWQDKQVNQQRNNFYIQLNKNMESAYIRPRYPAFHALELRNGRILQQFWENKLTLNEVINQLNGKN